MYDLDGSRKAGKRIWSFIRTHQTVVVASIYGCISRFLRRLNGSFFFSPLVDGLILPPKNSVSQAPRRTA